MGLDTMKYTGELVILSCWCGISHAVPRSLRAEQMRQKEEGKDPLSVYCPLGHTHVPVGESKAEKLQRRLNAEADRRARESARADQAEASARGHKGAATRARRKAAAGVCPVPGCGRTVRQLADHVAEKHPNFDPAAV